MRTLALDVPVADPMGTEVIAVPAGEEVALDLRLEAVMDGVLVTGTAQTRAAGECVRCLAPLSLDLDVDITEMFAYPGTQEPSKGGGDEHDEDEELLPELEGEILDLEATVTDAVVLALPFRPLCRADCPGLCPTCGVRLADAEPDHAHEQIDPRWSALAALAGAEIPTEADDDSEGAGESPQ
ncbi:YceD family protein [Ruania halotolerans]|nr:YceD family protein [Ruania halotolerans]UFU08348.1 YceD family protein [Ruania halotolerans]